MYTPKHLKKWRFEEAYIGTNWTEYYILLSKTDADSNVLNASNFAMALKELGGESETVVSACFKHFACGHFDLLLIHESDDKALQIADDIHEKLSDYPVLDDDDYSERELMNYEENVESWAYDDACYMLGIKDKDTLKPDNADRIKRACIDCMFDFSEAYIREDVLRRYLRQSKVITPFSWEAYEKSKGQTFLELGE
jgi:hypothetical protein